MDQDYVGKLTDKEKKWLSDFNEEYYGNKLSKKTLRNKAKRKEMFDQTNARNRDIFNIRFRSDVHGNFSETAGGEDALVDYIDAKRDAYIPDKLIQSFDDDSDTGR